MMRGIGRHLADMGINYDTEYRRLRCMGHVINLSVRSFWFGEEVDRHVLQDVIIVSEETLAEWRRIGPWGKAHNITTYIRSSVQRKQHLRRLGAETLLHAGNATRWNSGLSMILSLLRNWEAVDFFSAQDIHLSRDRLTEDDWKELHTAVEILEPFLASTLRLEGKEPNIWDVISEVDYLCGVYRFDHTSNDCEYTNMLIEMLLQNFHQILILPGRSWV